MSVWVGSYDPFFMRGWSNSTFSVFKEENMRELSWSLNSKSESSFMNAMLDSNSDHIFNADDTIWVHIDVMGE